MAASQGQREEQKDKKQSVRLDPFQQGSPSESTVNSHQNGVEDRAPATYPTTPSYSYYYPGHEALAGGDFYNQGYYVAGNTIDSQYPVVQTDGSMVYMMPGVYSPYMGVDGQCLGQQVYPVFHGDLLQTPYFWNTSHLLVADPGFANGFVGVSPSKHTYSSAPTVEPKPSKPSNLLLGVISRNEKQKPFNKHDPGYYHDGGNSGLLNSNKSVAREKPKVRSNLVENAETVNEKSSKSWGVKREQYNLAEFSTKYENALFFVIKSYSEDDIHKSIKYSVWASTPNGNKRLSLAFQEAQAKIAKTATPCPIFLFFSVNASGQFCGVAEMTGQVDFSKNMDFWQQSKWNGYFPVKWHIIKDIPNSQLRHVILQNNENKPVTNSRDTQEVKFRQGIDVLTIFKNYTSATSILDDFDFYENRQKIMQEKRLRQPMNHHDLQVKVEELITDIQAADLTTA